MSEVYEHYPKLAEEFVRDWRELAEEIVRDCPSLISMRFDEVEVISKKVTEVYIQKKTRSIYTEKNADEITEGYSEEQCRELAEEIVRNCPSLTQLLLAMGGVDNPLEAMN